MHGLLLEFRDQQGKVDRLGHPVWLSSMTLVQRKGRTPISQDELYDEMDVDATGNIPLDDIALALQHLPVPAADD